MSRVTNPGKRKGRLARKKTENPFLDIDLMVDLGWKRDKTNERAPEKEARKEERGGKRKKESPKSNLNQEEGNSSEKHHPHRSAG